MRAIRLDRIGPPENLKVVEVPIPSIDEHGVLVRTALSGLIYADVEARKGTYYSQTRLPWYPGREVAGIVERVGERVADIRPGDRVAALVLKGGCYAEYVAASTRPLAPGSAMREADIIVLPDTVTFGQSLVHLINFRLVHLLVHAWAKVPRGARVLVHGASGGMGSMVIQLARALDCTVIALVRSREEAGYCRRIGANHVIDITRSKYEDAVRDITEGKGVEFSFNGVGGETINRDPAIMAPFGEIHAYGYVAGKIDFHPFAVSKSLALKTFAADDYFSTSAFSAATAAMYEWFRTGPLLDVSEVFSFDDVAGAHRRLEEGRVLGKIALRP